MSIGATSWAFTQGDHEEMALLLQRFLNETAARCALVVDRSGQLVTTAGERPTFDPTAFATLTAADFSANDQLARLMGESEFSTLYHQGERESMLLAAVGRKVILVVLFDARTTLGLVRLRMRTIVEELALLLEVIFARRGSAAPAQPDFLADAVDEIDRLFK